MQLCVVQGCIGGGGGALTRAVTPSGRILFDNFMCALFVRVCVWGVCVCVQQLPVKRVANAAADDDDGDLH